MVNEDIITSLKNAIEHGETLELAIETAISSGYNRREVEDAAKFIGKGVLYNNQVRSEDRLTTPNQKGFFSMFSNKRKDSSIKPANVPAQRQEIIKPKNDINNLPDLSVNNQPYNKEMNSVNNFQEKRQTPVFESKPVLKPEPIKPMPPVQPRPLQPKYMGENYSKPVKKQSYIKEILLLVILMILIGILILIVKFKEAIINFFS
jgi:hypothetical protein